MRVLVFILFSFLLSSIVVAGEVSTAFTESSKDLVKILQSPTLNDEMKESGKLLQVRLISNGFHLGYQLITEKCQIDAMVVKSEGSNESQVITLPKECRH